MANIAVMLFGEHVMVGSSWLPLVGQAVGRGLRWKVLIGAVFFHSLEPSHPAHHPLFAIYRASEHTQVLHIHLEDGNCSVC
jgi:hypothetical protein